MLEIAEITLRNDAHLLLDATKSERSCRHAPGI
jgi:hypothetical protein